VVKTKPRLENGTPFPTLYYLTQQAATAAASTLEASGFMVELQDLLHDQKIAAQYLFAHQEYLREREEIELVQEIADFSAGGMPVRVKCLHALIGHSLAKGPGVNPMGDRALERLSWSPKVCSCV
jgi:hypothetical protein